MVKKLMKHELFALFRILLWLMLATILLGALARICYETMEYDEFGSSFGIGANFARQFVISMWNLSTALLLTAATIFSLVRFFQSLFTGEGYLTFSLPATPTQLLIAKFLSAMIATIACFAAVGLSEVIVMTASDWRGLFALLVEIFPAIGEFLRSEPLVGLEFILLLLLLLPCGLLYLYLVACIGQLFTKGRVPITIGLYYGLSFLIIVLFVLFLFPFIELAATSIHLLLRLLILFVAAFDVGSFFFIRYILMRKVNLVV